MFIYQLFKNKVQSWNTYYLDIIAADFENTAWEEYQSMPKSSVSENTLRLQGVKKGQKKVDKSLDSSASMTPKRRKWLMVTKLATGW